jgi:hypothetical protein
VSGLRKQTYKPSLFEALLRLIKNIQQKCSALFHRKGDDRFQQHPYHPEDMRLLERRTNQRANSVFFLFLFLFSMLSFIAPLRPTYSDLEQRNLTEFPTPTVATVCNGAFFSDMNTWFADTFPFREFLLKVESGITRLYGVQTTTVIGDVQSGDDIPDTPLADPAGSSSSDDSSGSGSDNAAASSSPPASSEAPDNAEDGNTTIPEISKDAKVEKLGAVLVIDDAAYEYYNFDQTAADSYIKLVNKAASKLDGKARVFNMVVPTSMDICVPESVRSGINTSSQEKALNYLHSSMASNVHKVDVFNTLLKHSVAGDYLYFRTDHHWTALGAYYAYEQFCTDAGQTPAALDQFEEVKYDNFKGSFYRDTKSSALGNHPDTVHAYIPPSTNTISITDDKNSTWDWDVVTDVSSWNSSSKYNAFIGGDNPISHIENPNKQDGSSVLLIKESFGNCFAPFLVENYQHVYILDYRYFPDIDSRSLSEVVNDLKIKDVLFLNNISAVRNKNAVSLMANLVG